MVSPWIATHFPSDEVSTHITFLTFTENMVGTGGILLSFDGTWDPSFISTAETRIDKLQLAYDESGVFADQLSAGTIGQGIQTKSGRVGRTSLGTVPCQSVIGPNSPLPPYVRSVVNFGTVTAGTFQLNFGIYGRP